MQVQFSRDQFEGSVLVKAYAILGGEEIYLGHVAVLSRFNRAACKNCLNKTVVHEFFELDGFLTDANVDCRHSHPVVVLPASDALTCCTLPTARRQRVFGLTSTSVRCLLRLRCNTSALSTASPHPATTRGRARTGRVRPTWAALRTRSRWW